MTDFAQLSNRRNFMIPGASFGRPTRIVSAGELFSSPSDPSISGLIPQVG